MLKISQEEQEFYLSKYKQIHLKQQGIKLIKKACGE